MNKLLLAMVAPMLLAGCTPRIEIAASKEPITINMNVKIEHEIHIKVDKDVENLLKSRSDQPEFILRATQTRGLGPVAAQPGLDRGDLF